MLANDFAFMVLPNAQGLAQGLFVVGAEGLAQSIARGHGQISQPPRVPYAANRAAFCEAQKTGLVPLQQLHQGGAAQAMSLVKVGQGRALGKLVPRTHQLAIITAINAVANKGAQLYGNAAGMLDGEVRDATPCI